MPQDDWALSLINRWVSLDSFCLFILTFIHPPLPQCCASVYFVRYVCVCVSGIDDIHLWQFCSSSCLWAACIFWAQQQVSEGSFWIAALVVEWPVLGLWIMLSEGHTKVSGLGHCHSFDGNYDDFYFGVQCWNAETIMAHLFIYSLCLCWPSKRNKPYICKYWN